MERPICAPVMTACDPASDWLESDIFRRLAEVAAHTPNALAVDDGQLRLSYGELLGLSRQLGSLIAARAPAGTVVAVFAPTNSAHIAAVLGVLAAGCTYVSLDPGYPDARLAEMAGDARAALVITAPGLRGRAAALGRPEIIAFDPAANGGQVAGGAGTARARDPDAFACLYFTSGSTGRPKAVVHTHRNILFDIRRQTRDMGVTASDRFDLLFSAAFSAFLSPVFGALLTGASVHPFPLKLRPVAAFRDWLTAEGITMSTMSVTSFRHLAGVLPPGRCFPAMRVISVGAEPLALHDLEAFRAHFPETCRMQNALATTETRTIAQILYPAHGSMPAEMSVGFPVDGKTIVLRDEEGRAVPVGEVGEIVVESSVISPGRWDELCETPGGALPGPRATIHRTGDLGRSLPDGRLLHLGRVDTQVKIRGHRIEVGEIENRLLAEGSVQNAAVFAAPGDAGRDVLVAMLVMRPGATCEPTLLRQHLGGQLPDYMVPQRMIAVEELPATPTGKVDRKRLPDHLAAHDAVTAHRRAEVAMNEPVANGTSGTLIELWRTVLKSERVGPDDDFFDLGGDSLAAEQLITAAQRLFGRHLPLGLLMTASTPRKMAAVLDSPRAGFGRIARLLLQSGDEARVPLFLIPPWNTGSVAFRGLVRGRSPGGPLWAVDGYDDPEGDHVAESVEEIAGLYVEALTEFAGGRPLALAGYSMGGFVAWEVARQLAAAGNRPRHVVLLDCSRLFARRSAEEEAWVRSGSSYGARIRLFLRYLSRPRPARGPRLSDVACQLSQAVVDKVRWHAGGRRAMDELGEAIFARTIVLSKRHEVRPYDGAVTLIRARNQTLWFNRYHDDLCWESFCPGKLNVIHLPGSHTTLLKPANVARIQAHLHALMAAW